MTARLVAGVLAGALGLLVVALSANALMVPYPLAPEVKAAAQQAFDEATGTARDHVAAAGAEAGATIGGLDGFVQGVARDVTMTVDGARDAVEEQGDFVNTNVEGVVKLTHMGLATAQALGGELGGDTMTGTAEARGLAERTLASTAGFSDAAFVPLPDTMDQGFQALPDLFVPDAIGVSVRLSADLSSFAQDVQATYPDPQATLDRTELFVYDVADTPAQMGPIVSGYAGEVQVAAGAFAGGVAADAAVTGINIAQNYLE